MGERPHRKYRQGIALRHLDRYLEEAVEEVGRILPVSTAVVLTAWRVRGGFKIRRHAAETVGRPKELLFGFGKQRAQSHKCRKA